MQIVAVQLAVENLKLEINSKKVLRDPSPSLPTTPLRHVNFTRPGAEKSENRAELGPSSPNNQSWSVWSSVYKATSSILECREFSHIRTSTVQSDAILTN